MILKHLKHLTLLLAASFFIFSCKKDDTRNQVDPVIPPKAADFAKIREGGLNRLVQKFTVDTENDIEIESEKGVSVRIVASSLKLNGEPVTGDIDLEFVEIFDPGDMLAANKRTMGRLPDGKLAMLITGGAFYINASQDGQPLDRDAQIRLLVPGELTGEADPDMILWDGELDDDGNLTWVPKKRDAGDGNDNLFIEGTQYYAVFSNFGWTNIDKFYNDPREKTQLWVKVPEGFDNKNSAVYLKYKGEPNALASMDVYDTEKKMFSEHYGQIPIGIECHLIFATESNENWRIAVKSVTIEEDGTYEFSGNETQVMTESAMIQLINDLP